LIRLVKSLRRFAQDLKGISKAMFQSRLDPSIDMQGLIEEGYIRLQKVYEYIRHMEQKAITIGMPGLAE
jgi:hypothetical protein